jgi:hypothetical protein
LSRVAMQTFVRAATQISKDGSFEGFTDLMTNAELNEFFAERGRTPS